MNKNPQPTKKKKNQNQKNKRNPMFSGSSTADFLDNITIYRNFTTLFFPDR